MKKVMIGLLSSMVLLIGCSANDEENPQDVEVSTTTTEESKVEDTENITEVAKEDEIEEEVSEPEITVNLENKPVWEVYDAIEMIDEYNPDEKYIMFEEAQLLEDKLIQEFSKEEHDGTLAKWQVYVDVLIGQTKEYHPEQQEYFEKLEEVSEEIMKGSEKEEVVKLVEEAKELREENAE